MRVYNIPVFVPHKGCPFDCVFCNQRKITGTTTDVTPNDVQNIIEEHLKTLPKEDRYVEVAFFGGSFTGIPIDEQSALMEAVAKFGAEIDGIRLSTRPDYINEEIMNNLVAHGVTTIELGVQSMDDEVLRASNRGHTSEQVRKAVEIIRKYPVRLGLQMMTGLVGDTREKSIYTAKEIIKLKPEMVRIYPTLTIKDTYLEKLYNKGLYTPQTLEEAVETAKIIMLMFEESNINVIRVGLQATNEISSEGSVVAGPVHSAFRALVESSIYYDLIKSTIAGKSGNVTIEVKDSEVSNAVGNKRANIEKIKQEFGIKLKIRGNKEMNKREVRYIAT